MMLVSLAAPKDFCNFLKNYKGSSGRKRLSPLPKIRAFSDILLNSRNYITYRFFKLIQFSRRKQF